MKKIAVILSGCGVFDGAEIHEATLSLLSIAKAGASYSIFAPDKKQHHVINHLTGEEMSETRNVLIESARIARGKIQPISAYHAADFDALLLPGGFGAAKNLSTVAFHGAQATIDTEVEKAIIETHKAQKPIGALCIAPVLLAAVLKGAEVTIGTDASTIAVIEQLGGKHKKTTHGEVVVDQALKLATTPCYMLDASILQIADGADAVVNAILKMT